MKKKQAKAKVLTRAEYVRLVLEEMARDVADIFETLKNRIFSRIK